MTLVEFKLLLLHHQTFLSCFLQTKTNCLKESPEGSASIMKINHYTRSSFEDYGSLLNPKCVNQDPHYNQQAAEYEEAQISPQLDGLS